MVNNDYDQDLIKTIRYDRLMLTNVVLMLLVGIGHILFMPHLSLLVRLGSFGICMLIAYQNWHLHRIFIKPMIRIKREVYALDNEEDRVKRQRSIEIMASLAESNDMMCKVFGRLVTDANIHSEEKALNAEVALFALQSEINPHFLYNSLEVIRNKANKNGMEEISDMALALARVFRYSISRPGEIATLADEINNVKNYIKIQQYRFPGKFDINYDIDMTDFSLLQCRLPVLTLQPIVENALNHGIEPMTGKGNITIRAFVSDRKLTIVVTDTGIGMSEDKLEELRQRLDMGFTAIQNGEIRNLNHKAGISLNNVNSRLKIFFGEEYGLNITSYPGSFTTVEIVVPKVMSL